MKINLKVNNLLVVSLIALGLAGLRMISVNIVDINIDTILIFITYYVFSFIPLALIFMLKRRTFLYVLLLSALLVIIYLIYGKITYELPSELLLRLFFYKIIAFFSMIGSIVYVYQGLKIKQINLIFLIYIVVNIYMFIDVFRHLI